MAMKCETCSHNSPFTTTWVDGETCSCTASCINDVYNKLGGKTVSLTNLKTSLGTPVSTASGPTIRVRNLFLTVLYSGEDTLAPLIRSLRQRGETTPIVILSGVHGTEAGLMTVSGFWPMHRGPRQRGIVDDTLRADDRKMVKKLDTLHSIKDVMVRKAYSKHDPNTKKSSELQVRTTGILNAGSLVIWGWCHSLFSTREFTRQDQQSGLVDCGPAWAQKISTIVNSDYKPWVPLP